MNCRYYREIISAISTPLGNGAISVVRVSGDNLQSFSEAIFRKKIPNKKPTLANIYDEDNIIDNVLVLFFHAPHSYTGEDVIEIHGHGGLVVTHMILDLCLRAGARLAEPGEFTLRAYYNNKVDLTQIEAISDIINAQSEAMVKAAAKNINGSFSNLIKNIREQLIHVRTHTEAFIDFPEEEITFPEKKLLNSLSTIENDLTHILRQSNNNNILNHGPRIVLTGYVNAGKSSILNALLKKDRSIVSNIAGTTRNTIEENLVLESTPVLLIDTAGINDEATNEIEKIGIEKTWKEISQADITLLVLDVTCYPAISHHKYADILKNENSIVILNKIDLLTDHEISSIENELTQLTAKTNIIRVCAITGYGIEELKQVLKNNISQKKLMDCTLYINKRHEKHIDTALQHLQLAKKSVHHLEIFAEELRLTAKSLEEIIGFFSDDDLLTEIFSQFCIGK
ncbi:MULTISPECIES: tRNA uridine-5-carboxymethylaminomethyl(34) synthesis GTPase MnmE [Candidatus Ichthyocystis]|uniref:tRNA modification GTPase MnmE n=1 Tax=Candidatus Ichthyocystis hellenicum TaxID=1561003 RepID=A0A0S4M131_9BURK|nr:MULTISPECIES: tRNA uridine-5-carboxymethylaminomethyl(34) synthesis GTPase MnmE [Ichthyocystis]CUT17345.1 putative tRNA modification GTPase MnmE [Candidatus Ichthyocystis hellenicum]